MVLIFDKYSALYSFFRTVNQWDIFEILIVVRARLKWKCNLFVAIALQLCKSVNYFKSL